MIKTITANNPTVFDAQVNAFEVAHNVFATQTHVNIVEGQETTYTAVIFYKAGTEYNRS